MHSCMLWVWLLQFHQIEIVLHVTLLHYVHMSFTGHSTSRRWTTRAPQVLPEGSATQPAELLEKLQNALPKDRWLGKHTGFKKIMVLWCFMGVLNGWSQVIVVAWRCLNTKSWSNDLEGNYPMHLDDLRNCPMHWKHPKDLQLDYIVMFCQIICLLEANPWNH